MMAWIFRRKRHLSDELLSAYADGSLGATENRHAEAHLATCDGDCATRFDGLQTTLSVLRAVSTAPAPRSFALSFEQVHEPALRLEPERRLGSVPVLAPAFAATAAAVVFAVLLVGNITGAIEQSGGAGDLQVETAAGEGDLVRSTQKESAQAAAPATMGGGEESAAPAESMEMMQAASTPTAEAQVRRERAAVETVVVEQEMAVAAADAPPPQATPSPPPEVAKDDTSLAAPAPDTSRLTLPVTPLREDREEPALEPTPIQTEAEPRAAPSPAATPSPLPTAAETAPAPSPAVEEALELAERSESKAERVEQFAQGAAEDAPSDDGIALPVWQLESVFGALAVVFAGMATFLIRRRRSS